VFRFQHINGVHQAHFSQADQAMGTSARIAGATDGIPRDRILDGNDQTAISVKGDTHGRRDYIHMYEMDVLQATVK
jgi:hypothetical protein